MPSLPTSSPSARSAAALLGGLIRTGRLERRWTMEELAERVGVSAATISKLEKGDLGVALGTAFEAAVIVGVPLFDTDPARRALEAERVGNRLALLPSTARPTAVDDDF